MAQTLTLANAPTSDQVLLIVNGKTYIVNSTPGVTMTGGTNVITWDETVTGYLLDSATDIIRVWYGVDTVV